MLNKITVLLVIGLLLLCKGNLHAQNSVFIKDSSLSDGRILIESGGRASFHINSFRSYTEGVTLKDWTRIALDISDAVDENDEWKLEVQPMGNAGGNLNELEGDYYGRKLDVAFIGISAKPIINPNGSIEDSNIPALDGQKQILITGRGNGRFVIMISYHIGMESPLLGQAADYYELFLDFHLTNL